MVVPFVSDLIQHRGYRPEAMITFGSPMSDHLIGLELKKLYNLPWLAHFSDPWVDNPFKNFSWISEKANRKFERQVFEEADALLFTSDETIDLVMAKYPKELRRKCGLLTHSYESNKYMTPQVRESQITIRFLGDLYGPRTPRPLFTALNAINKESPELLRDVKFEFVGSMCELNVWEMGLRELPDGLVHLCDTVPHSRSLELMTSADGLLVIDAPATTSPFLPSKLIDYIGAGRPVFGITPPGTASRIISELGGRVGNPSDPEAVKKSTEEFIKALRGLRRENHRLWGEENVRLRYEADSVGEGFRNLVMDLVELKSGVAFATS
jgi:hypothetical protein